MTEHRLMRYKASSQTNQACRCTIHMPCLVVQMFQSFIVFENNVDSIQLASNEISWSGSLLFVRHLMNPYL